MAERCVCSKDCSQGSCSFYCPQGCFNGFAPPRPREDSVDFRIPIALICIFTGVILLAFSYRIISMFCTTPSSGRRGTAEAATSAATAAVAANRGPRHERWTVATPAGLDDTTIKSIATCRQGNRSQALPVILRLILIGRNGFGSINGSCHDLGDPIIHNQVDMGCRYIKGDGLVGDTDCPVCLNEFHDGEEVRLLPDCCHAFHLDCIDMAQIPLELPPLPGRRGSSARHPWTSRLGRRRGCSASPSLRNQIMK